MLVFERCGWWCWPEEGTTLENEPLCSFSGVCGWWLSWRGQPPRKRAQTLVFERCGGWCWQDEGPTPENERSCSFDLTLLHVSWHVLNTSDSHYRWRGGVWVLVVVVVREVLLAKGTFNPRKRAQQLVFGEGCGSWWWWLSGVVMVARGRSKPQKRAQQLFFRVVRGGSC